MNTFFNLGLTTQQKIKIVQQSMELLSRPECWTCEFYARDQDGYSTQATSDTAVQWCARGALQKFTSQELATQCADLNIYAEFHGLVDLCKKQYNLGLIDINDKLGREEVLKIFRDYLVLLQAEENLSQDVNT